VQRQFRVLVPSISALPAFIRRLLATVPGLLARHTLADLDHVMPPVECPTMPRHMIWHLRYQQDPTHRWPRSQLQAEVSGTLSGES